MLDVPTCAPATALVNAEQALIERFDSDNPELPLMREAIRQLRLRDWTAADAVTSTLSELAAARFAKSISSSGFRRYGRPAQADTYPHCSLIRVTRSGAQVSVHDMMNGFDDSTGHVVRATGDRALQSAIWLALWAASTGRNEMLKSMMANMSRRYRLVLDAILFEHGLRLWDSAKNAPHNLSAP